MTGFKRWLAVAAMAVGFAGTASADQPTIRKAYTPTPQPLVRTFPNTGPIPLPYPTPILPRVDFDYVVLYKASLYSPWRTYGKFETLFQAEHAERRLALAGFAVRVQRVRDVGPFGW